MPKKIYSAIIAIVLSLGSTFALNMQYAAATKAIQETITASASSAVANGTSAITLTISSQRYRCSRQYIPNSPDQPFYVYPSSDTSECNAVTRSNGTPNTQNLSPAVLVPNSWPYDIAVSGSGNILSASHITTNASGIATVTLKSTVSGTKTVSLIMQAKGTAAVATKTVTFTATASSTPSTTTTSPTVSAPAPATAAQSQPKPQVPSVTEIKVGTQTVSTKNTISLRQSQPMALSGKTVANGTVTLTIHSTPRTATVKADKNGDWSYTVTGLEPGDHYVEASVLNPATNTTSATTKLVSFHVAAETAPATTAPTRTTPPTSTPAAHKKSHTAVIVAASIVGVILIGGVIGWALWRKRKQQTNVDNTPLYQPLPRDPNQPTS